jgi:hypothetical protein
MIARFRRIRWRDLVGGPDHMNFPAFDISFEGLDRLVKPASLI